MIKSDCKISTEVEVFMDALSHSNTYKLIAQQKVQVQISQPHCIKITVLDCDKLKP